MDIDLELPSGQEEKLDTEFNNNVIEGDLGDNPGPDLGENNGLGTNIVRVDIVDKGIINYEPKKGLEFESKEAAYSFYREYARSVGFGITIKASRRSKKSGKFIDVKIACSRFGNKREPPSGGVNSRSCPKTDCKASMHMKRRQDGKWFIFCFVKEHNHEICPDDFYYSIRGRNKQSAIVACQKKGLQLMLDERDVDMLLDNFTVMQADNPNFFYALDLDQEKRMRNVFWVDSKGRQDYANFCDVVFFDTTYIKNKYTIPFIPIIGVNNHFQIILLGCALIEDDMASTFIWLMRTWLRAVGGQKPGVIITDEDKPLKEAIEAVFPNVHHCFCLWHVLGKIPLNLCCITDQFENFMSKFNKCVFRSWTDEEFEKRWWKMVDNFELKEHEWIQSLYEDRKKWVPAYMRDTCLAGLCERSESISFSFNNFISRETTLKEIIDQYKVFLRERYEEEAKADIEMRIEQPTLRSLSPFEKQLSTVYTHAIFKKFQDEILGTVACNLQKECEGEPLVIFRVEDFEERQNFIVTWNEAELDIRCLCRSFEYRGFLCRHAIIVLQMSGVSIIPSRYILKRWTKDAKNGQIVSGLLSNTLHYRVQRFDDLCKLAVKLGEKGSLSRETYDIAFHAIEEALKHCVGVNSSVRSVLDPLTLATQRFLNFEEELLGSKMAKAIKKKKTKKKRKVQSQAEVISMGMQNSSQQMEQLNPRAHPLDISYIPQQDMQGMDLGSRTPNLDGYYGAQHSVQGVGQLNSFSSIRDGYYSNQHGMQGLGQLNTIPSRIGHYSPQQNLQGLLQGQLSFRAPNMHGCFDIQDSLHEMEPAVNITSKHLHDKHLPL